jgi:hypothetical protein
LQAQVVLIPVRRMTASLQNLAPDAALGVQLLDMSEATVNIILALYGQNWRTDVQAFFLDIEGPE